MSTINDLPEASNFGEAFNYDVWTPNTIVTLCNVPWNSDYRDIVEFANRAALDTYLTASAGPSVAIGRLTVARANAPIRLNLPFNACYQYNYIRVNNNTSPISASYVDAAGTTHTITDTPKTMYYFVSGVNYLAPNTTEIVVELDAWQTFGFDIQFGNCYIEQGHIGVANENQFANNGRDYLTVTEGLDIGEEYVIRETYRKVLAADYKPPVAVNDPDVPDTNFTTPWVVMGIAADVTANPGTTAAPNLSLWTGGAGSLTENMPNGFDILVFTDIVGYLLFIANFAGTPWITQTIQFITMIPPIRGTESSEFTDVGVYNTATGGTIRNCCWHFDSGGLGVFGVDVTVASDFRDRIMDFIPSRYQHLKKFQTYPYSLVELTTYNATPLVLKPELIPDANDLVIDLYQHMAPPSPRWGIVPRHYNATGTGGGLNPDGNYDDGEYFDFATYISNFPQFTVMNNGYLSYLGANAASLSYQEKSAGWGQQKALRGADVGLQNMFSGSQNAMQQAKIQVDANNQRMRVANLGGIAGVANDLAAGIATGGTSLAFGGAQSIASAGTDAAMRSGNNAVANSVIQQSTAANIGTAADIGGNNFKYAQFAANGDYSNTIAGIQAQIQNAKMTQPSMVGQIGGESFFVSIGNKFTLYGKLKTINPNFIAVIGEYWLRYGYQVNRFGTMPDSLQVMSKFTFWKLKETYITSSRCPEIYKQTIRGIFEKGVTVWANPADIGNIDLGTNAPLTGISY